MRPSQVKKFLKMGMKASISIFVRGKPGIGKTSIIKSIVEDETKLCKNNFLKAKKILGKSLFKDLTIEKREKIKGLCIVEAGKLKEDSFGFVDKRLSQIDELEVKGLPHADETTKLMAFFSPDDMPTEDNYKFKNVARGILLFDEMNQGKEAVLDAIFEIVFDRAVGGKPLKPGWKIIATGNLGDEDGTTVTDFTSALQDRMITIDMEYDLKDWIKWAKGYGIDESIVSFIDANPAYLMFIINEDTKWSVTPRTWHRLDTFIKSNLDDESLDTEYKRGMARVELATFAGFNIIQQANSLYLEYLNDRLTLSAKEILLNYQDKKIKEIVKTIERSKEVSLKDGLIFSILNGDVKATDKKCVVPNFLEFIYEKMDADTRIAVFNGFKDEPDDDRYKLASEFTEACIEQCPKLEKELTKHFHNMLNIVTSR